MDAFDPQIDTLPQVSLEFLEDTSLLQVWRMNRKLALIGRRIRLYAPPYANTKMGAINEQEFRTEAEMNGLVIKDYKAAYTNDLIDKINDFDLAKVRAEATAYRG